MSAFEDWYEKAINWPEIKNSDRYALEQAFNARHEKWRHRYHQLFINIESDEKMLRRRWPDGTFDMFLFWDKESEKC